MTDIVEILSDLDGPITDEDRMLAAKIILKGRLEKINLNSEINNLKQKNDEMHILLVGIKHKPKEIWEPILDQYFS